MTRSTAYPADAQSVTAWVEEHYVEDVEASCPDCGHPVENCQCPPDFEDAPPHLERLDDDDLASLFVWVAADLTDAANGTPEDGPQAPPKSLIQLRDQVAAEILARMEVVCETCGHTYDDDHSLCQCDVVQMNAERDSDRI